MRTYFPIYKQGDVPLMLPLCRSSRKMAGEGLIGAEFAGEQGHAGARWLSIGSFDAESAHDAICRLAARRSAAAYRRRTPPSAGCRRAALPRPTATTFRPPARRSPAAIRHRTPPPPAACTPPLSTPATPANRRLEGRLHAERSPPPPARRRKPSPNTCEPATASSSGRPPHGCAPIQSPTYHARSLRSRRKGIFPLNRYF